MTNAEIAGPICRFCATPLHKTVVDLGMSPLCESFLNASQLNQMEPFYPLHVYVCDHCFLVQLEEYVSPQEIFSEYAYFSSFADTWLQHCKAYTETMIARFGYNQQSHIVEIASNDGYLLQYFVEKGIPALGVEPAANVARTAVEKGVPTRVEFFGTACAEKMKNEGLSADLLIGNNVLAQVPDLNDFVAGLKILLKPGGVITIEFPHLMRLVEGNQFDTIYHEHFSYFSLYSVEKIFAAHGLTLFDAEEMTTHGGSLRIFAHHNANDQGDDYQSSNSSQVESERLIDLRKREADAGINRLDYYAAFDAQVKETKRKLLDFLISVRRQGKTIAGYGAPGKGNTLLNYCGIRTDFLDYTVDRNPYKHGKFLPGTHIPIFHPDKIRETRPDYVLILPWNFKDEIMRQNSFIAEWGGQFIVPIPSVRSYQP